MSSSAEDGLPVHRLPSASAVARAKSRLRRRYRIVDGEIDDLLGDAIMGFLRVRDEIIADPDGLFLCIVDRRAQDFIEERRRSESLCRQLVAGDRHSQEPDERAADVYLRAQALSRLRIPGTDKARLRRLLRAIASGTPAEQAFRKIGIPPGSWSRYRATLMLLPEFFDRLAKKPRSFSPPSNDL